MREAMANAEVGDDVFGEDPTVNRLQAIAAALTGQEAALFVTSGTQGNLTAILTHCNRGDEMIVGRGAHTFRWEVGGASALGGVHPYTIPIQPDGTLTFDDIRQSIRDASDDHQPITRLVVIENTNGAVGGIPLTVEYTRSVAALCREHGLKLHIDGARIFNAAAALGCEVKDLAGPADSISFCLSKGLCAPAGSLLCGSREFIARARKTRKMLGGGMRQTGILAAAGIVALEQIAPRLHEDHANARRLAEGLARIPGLRVDLNQVQTNMVYFTLDESLPLDAPTFADILDHECGIRVGDRDNRTFRAVTHYWIKPEHVDQTLDAIRTVLERHTR
jgi:threonine aldolase